MASLGVSGGADGVCNTELCLKFAQDIKHDMNLNIDPCTDFYQYSCKNNNQSTI